MIPEVKRSSDRTDSGASGHTTQEKRIERTTGWFGVERPTRDIRVGVRRNDDPH